MSNVLPFERPRPEIQITHELHDVVNQAIASMRGDEEVFHRDGVLVRVVRADGDDVEWTPGAPQIRNVVAPTLAERLTIRAEYKKLDGRTKKWVGAHPPNSVVDAVLARGSWPGLRPLVGVLETPSLRHDGTLLDVPGYDRATGYLYVPNATYVPPPERPTQQDAVDALADLCDVFVDFPFARPDHALVPLAAILTLIARPMIRGAVPGFLFDATTPGSGKSLLSDVVAFVATGRAAPRMTFPATDEELEKACGAYVLLGARMIPFDNITRGFGGGPLDKLITATDRVELRELGRSAIVSAPWRGVVLGSGNNLQVVGDTARRVLLARLEPATERPQDRTAFAHPHLLRWVSESRPRLVRSCLTLLSAWQHAERPTSGARWGSFEEWSAVIPPALAFAGAPDVLAARVDAAEQQDPTLAAIRALLGALPRLDHDSQGVTLRALLDRLYPPERLSGHAPPDGHDDTRDALEALAPVRGGRPDSTKLAYAFRRFRGRVLGGRKLEAVPGRAGSVRWKVVTP